MARRRLQSEILVSLLLVMATATGLLGAVILRTHHEDLEPLRLLAAHALVEKGRRPLPASDALPALRWWRLEGGAVRPIGAHALPIDPESRALAAEALEAGTPVMRTGSPWEPVRLATPTPDGAVAVARLPRAASPLLLLGLLVADVAVFTAFGLYLLRRRLVMPLQHLAAAARALAAGDLGTRAPVGGAAEIAEVAVVFNEMSEALAARSRALEKAVSDLRESNRSLRDARAGLDRAERLAAVGRLAAGVAHEVGNPMGALVAYLDLVRRDAGLTADGREHLGRAAREGERVRRILRQLLDFSRPPQTRRQAVDLLALCRQAVDLVRTQRRYAAIGLEVGARGAPPPAHADPGVVSQILLNLLLNAADALDAAGTPEPRIRVRVRAAVERPRTGEPSQAATGRRRGDAVECVVEDNGPGIAPEDRERIFDPFFTTKPAGEGTGLGLANALRFAEELGGSLTLEHDAPGPGARFVLRLPASPDPHDTSTRA